MSRLPNADVRTVAPTNNVYTALAAAACVIVIAGIIAMFLKADSVGGLL